MESLQEFFSIMLKDHRSELLSYDSKLSNADFACSFIHNAMCYAVVNNREEVGPREMLHTLKNWEYIPWDLRRDIATDVINKMNLDEETPLYRKEGKKKARVISFDKVKRNE